MTTRILFAFVLFSFALAPLSAGAAKKNKSAGKPAPAAAASAGNVITDISYGEHPRQVLDIHLPKSGGKAGAPYPIVMFIHGGGWSSGDKVTKLDKAILDRVLAGGCALVAIEYRLLADAKKANIFPPVIAPLTDAKSALQFLRLNAARWNLDPARVVVYGGSAGAYSSLWLALSPDMANPDAAEPAARMSTRVLAAGCFGAQTSIDPRQMREWTGPKMKYGCRAFGINSFEEFFRRRDEFAKYYPSLSPASLVSADDPPVFLRYETKLDDSLESNSYHTHSPRFGLGFLAVAKKAGAACTLSIPESEYNPDGDMIGFLIERAKAPLSSASK